MKRTYITKEEILAPDISTPAPVILRKCYLFHYSKTRSRFQKISTRRNYKYYLYFIVLNTDLFTLGNGQINLAFLSSWCCYTNVYTPGDIFLFRSQSVGSVIFVYVYVDVNFSSWSWRGLPYTQVKTTTHFCQKWNITWGPPTSKIK